ncbi:type 2A phosphatase activator TIP41 [Pseudozyma hubeiensis SY62]|uniref:Type 2A phosphatase activator TIP41 n=1 Tax=Pseudozyma hubeiensis (strain SY62) TaxID=1305764 RepID=R9PFT0_PSEHS|nr:type 2A phosphatase activator TIP41 [Pseudozyma hubeiensis SY62]GAC96935.1 type 2A phosphatase activator TIP41 [Pseudozyma hubeiensis SY62]
MDALAEVLGIPPPEMAFPHNSLVLQHAESGFNLCFDAVRTLRSVEGVRIANRLHGVDCRDAPTGEGKSSVPGAKPKARTASSIKVAYAKEWGKSRTDFVASSSSADETTASETGVPAGAGSHFGSATADITAAKDYDWTYSTTWAGSLNSTSPQQLLPSNTTTTPSIPPSLRTLSSSPSTTDTWFEPGTDPATDRIPIERLGPSSGEPILFYDDIVLYEDELADNGSSIVNVKVRVMPSGFLVLQRFFLRVDDVVFRVFDTRLYCEFPPAGVGRSIGGVTGGRREGGVETSMAGLRLGDAPRKVKSKDEDVVMSSNDGAGEEEGFVPRLIRECSGSSADYALVRSHLPPYKPHDLSPLTDVNWVTQTLTKIERSRVAKYHANVAAGTSLPRLGERDANAGAKYVAPAGVGAGAGRFGRILSGSTPVGGTTGFPGTRPGERMDLSPAQAPSSVSVGGGSAQILGEVNDSDDTSWQGCGARVDVAVLRPRLP